MATAKKTTTKKSSIKSSASYMLIILATAIVSGSTVYFWKQGEVERMVASQKIYLQDHDNLLAMQRSLAIANIKVAELEGQVDLLISNDNDLAMVAAKYRDLALKDVSFDEKVKVGDKFGDLTVSSIEPLVPTMKIGFNYVEDSEPFLNLKIVFSGETTLTGHYSFSAKGEENPYDRVCFDNLDLDSEIKMPRLVGSGDTKFCFGKEAMVMLGKNSGTTTVRIKNYTLNYYSVGGLMPSAELVKVVSKE